jgi:hypothetical protein
VQLAHVRLRKVKLSYVMGERLGKIEFLCGRLSKVTESSNWN